MISSARTRLTAFVGTLVLGVFILVAFSGSVTTACADTIKPKIAFKRALNKDGVMRAATGLSASEFNHRAKRSDQAKAALF